MGIGGAGSISECEGRFFFSWHVYGVAIGSKKHHHHHQCPCVPPRTNILRKLILGGGVALSLLAKGGHLLLLLPKRCPFVSYYVLPIYIVVGRILLELSSKFY